MPAGACVLRYDGKRGVTWSLKYLDAEGRQARERLGRAADGWNRRKAEAALRARLVAVERDGFRRPSKETFGAFADEWLETYPEARDHRRTTRADYRRMVERHFVPTFGDRTLASISTADVDAYVAAKKKDGLGPRTLGLHVTRLHSILESARKQGKVTANPVKDVERPKVPKSRWTILSPSEIAAVMRAFAELVAESEDADERAWLETARAMVVAMQYAWLRRGELLGLRWRDVELAHPDGPRLHVRQTWVRGAPSHPKTDDGSRTIALDEPLAEELWAHRARSSFDGDDELVFPHPLRGTPVPSGYFGPLVRRALGRAGVDRPMREFHDWRHTGITNAAAAGMSPHSIMQMAGHADYKTTRKYIDLAEVVFGDEVRRLSEWYSGGGTKNRYENGSAEAESRSGSGVEAVSD